MLTHLNLSALIDSGVQTMGIGQGDRIGHILPLFHLYGLREMQITIATGATLVLSTQAAFPASLLKWFSTQRITGFPGVPGQFSLFLGRYREQLARLGSHLRYILLGTAPTPADLLENLRATLPNTRIFKTYGLTECGRVTTGDFTPSDSPANSVGPAAPGVDLTVRDADGQELPRGTAGRIFISSDMVMKGYWNRPRDTAEVLEGSCFTTRDLGYVDEMDRVFLVARADEMINTGGEKTAPWEVELVLRQHPAIANAAVIAMPAEDGVLGQVPKAFVVLKPDAAIQIDELLQHCARHLEGYKVPRKVVFLPQLPQTSLGKVHLQTLKQMKD
jgi:acyl-CoA synthetase (AMP-forming)/AMP-acid ligase II